MRGYDLTFDGMVPRQGPNYRELIAHFTVRRDGDVIGVLEPSKRTFPQRGMSDHRGRAADARRFASSISRSATSAPTARSRCGSITSRWCC